MRRVEPQILALEGPPSDRVRADPLPSDLMPSWLAALHLASPALPVGGFAYSQGLEWAIEEGVVHDHATAYAWIRDGLVLGLSRQELVLWGACFDAVDHHQPGLFSQINRRIYALKETAELRQETLQMGQSLARLFPMWHAQDRLTGMVADGQWTYPAAHAALCAVADVGRSLGMIVYAWAWSENQVLAAVKHVPLGQTQGQAMLHALRSDLQKAVAVASATPIEAMGAATLGMAIASARHETQYSRLFRS